MSNNKDLIPAGGGFSNLMDSSIGDAIADELFGLDGGFERIKIPSAGSTMFEVPGENPNEPEAVKEFSAVILYHHPLHAYYVDKYTGGNNPPDCGSIDGIKGVGKPGVRCESCPHNRFGSGENGGKACKTRRRLYLLREGEVFPLLLSLPTGSLKEFSQYLKRVLAKGKKSSGVVTKFSLRKAVNSGGIAYSQAQFSVDRELTAEEQAIISTLSEQVKAYSKNVGFDETEESAEEIIPVFDLDTGEVVEPLK